MAGRVDTETSAAAERNRLRQRFRVWRGGADSASAPPPSMPPEPDSSSRLELMGERQYAIHAAHAEITRSAVGRLRGGDVQLRNSAAAVGIARDVTMQQSAAVALAGARLNVSQSAGQWLLGGIVQARQVTAITVIAGKIEGDVRCLFDAKGAFAFGAGIALVSGLLRFVLRRK